MEPAGGAGRSRLRLGVLLFTVVLLSVGVILLNELQLVSFYGVGSFSAGKGNALVAAEKGSDGGTSPPADTPPPTPVRSRTTPPRNYNRAVDGDLATDFECVGWRRTGESSPDGWREPESDGDCAAPITECVSGYCLFRNKATNATRRALLMHNNSIPCTQTIRCEMVPGLLNYGYKAPFYQHDSSFKQEENRDMVRLRIQWEIENRNKSLAAITTDGEVSFERGITMVVHSRVVGSAYISIRSLRAMGCTLPIEMWIRRDEVLPNDPLVVEMVANLGVFLREISDGRASGYYTKLHAVYYTVFDHVLLLDADNFATKDPTYLFDTPEYKKTGAMFWPDFWRPWDTIFHIIKVDILWEVLGIDYVDMFEQESGQVLIDRRRHQKAIDVLMYYGFTFPRVIEDMQFEWGDKDLFRFAWMKTNSSFHYIDRPAGCGGRYHTEKKIFCGATMVQHDPKGDVIFMHRNQEKMWAGSDNKRVWTHIEQLHLNASLEHYKLAHQKWVFDDMENCWGLEDRDRDYYDMTPIQDFPFADIETRLLQYATDAGEIIGYKPTLPPLTTQPPPPAPPPSENSDQPSADTSPSPAPGEGTTEESALRRVDK